MDAQQLDTHKKVLGIIYIITACLVILAALFVRALMSVIFGFAFENADPEEQRVAEFVLMLTSFLPAVLIIFSGIPTLIAGIGLLMRATWAPIIALIVGILKLISFPIGTAIGIYAIWIYSEDQKQKKVVRA